MVTRMTMKTTFPLRFRLSRGVVLSAFALLAAACTSEQSLGQRPDESQLGRCREACNKLKFFDCNTATEQAACYQSCDAASSDQIDLFEACVDASTCDPACSTNIRPESPPPVTSAEGCIPLCESYLGDGCVPELSTADCAAFCADPDTQLALTYCIERRVGCALPEGCITIEDDVVVTPPDPEADPGADAFEACVEGCERLGALGCISPVDTAECSALCETADSSTQDRLVTCADAATCFGPMDDTCYQLINPAGGSPDVAGCRAACDHLSTFECIDSFDLSTCREICAERSRAAVETFKSCSEGICEDDSCFFTLLEASE